MVRATPLHNHATCRHLTCNAHLTLRGCAWPPPPLRIIKPETRKKGPIVAIVKTFFDEKRASREAEKKAERFARNAANAD
jgi:hypothetical protein